MTLRDKYLGIIINFAGDGNVVIRNKEAFLNNFVK